MQNSLLNLISTPVAVLNSLGLNVKVGLSSDDPMVGRNPSEPYDVFLSVYSAEGVLLERSHLGLIPSEKRRIFDITSITRREFPKSDHLAVVHRVPSRLLSQVNSVEDAIEIQGNLDYSLFRSMVEYSYTDGGSGSVIYETPPGLNAGAPGSATSNTLTFTCQTILSESLNTYVALIHYSTNPTYTQIAEYHFGLYNLGGELVFTGQATIGPFSCGLLDLAQLIPTDIVLANKDPRDGLSSFNFVGFSDEAVIMPVIINAAPSMGAVAVEHTHPPQTYMFPKDFRYRKTVKTAAQNAWRTTLSRSVTRDA